MILKYGSYSHSVDEVGVVIGKQAQLNDQKLPFSIIETWTINGFIQADTQAALTTALNSLEAAYDKQSEDIGLYLDDGTTATSHVINSSTAIGGVRVMGPPGYPVGEGAEYSTFRRFVINIQAEIPASGNQIVNVLEYQETISFEGLGGPRDVVLETRNGSPVTQTVSQRTPFFATQTGSALGYRTYVGFPSPIWPRALDAPSSSKSIGSPEVTGKGKGLTFSRFPTNWNYRYQSSSQLTGRPTARPI